jgi:hypothetical protein
MARYLRCLLPGAGATEEATMQDAMQNQRMAELQKENSNLLERIAGLESARGHCMC